MPNIRRLKQAAQDLMLPRAPSCPILARDNAKTAIEATRRNAQAAGVADDIRFEVADIGTLTPEGPTGICARILLAVNGCRGPPQASPRKRSSQKSPTP